MKEKKEYHNVEFASPMMKGFRNFIINIDGVKKLSEQYHGFEAFTSMYLYSDDIFKYLNKNRADGKSSISGYDGPIFSRYFFIDIDSKDLMQSQEVAQQLVSFLYDQWNVQKPGITVAFTGNRGYHIGIDKRIFGEVQPIKYLNRVYAVIRKELPGLAGIKESECIDQAISDKTRLWRLVNTRHHATDLYKIQIGPDDLYSLSVREMKELATSPQPVVSTDETGLIPKMEIGPVGEAIDIYQRAFKKINQKKENRYCQIASITIDDSRNLKETLCPARYGLLKSHVPEGQRNQAALFLASSLRSGGYSAEMATNIILEWNRSNEIGLNEYELMNVVKSVYRAKNGYGFGCNKFERHCPYKNRNGCKDYRVFKSSVPRKD